MKKLLLTSIIIASLISCKQSTTKQDSPLHEANYKPTLLKDKKKIRYGMVTGIKPDKIAYYKNLHAHPWPGVQQKIKECNIENYSIFIQEISGKYFLFSYFEYTGSDFDADMKKMAADTTTQRWWQETDPTQIPLPQASAKKQIWTRMDEVFYQQ